MTFSILLYGVVLRMADCQIVGQRFSIIKCSLILTTSKRHSFSSTEKHYLNLALLCGVLTKGKALNLKYCVLCI